MLAVLSPGEMRETERRAFSRGVPSLLLMEHAALGVTEHLDQMMGGSRGNAVCFFCGEGNNGGDGLAAARLFHLRGGQAHIMLLGGPKTPDALTNLRYAQALGIPLVSSVGDLPPLQAAVDAVFGIGLNRAPEGPAKEMIEAIEGLGVPVLAVDVPSGLDALRGGPLGACVRADRTLSLQCPKIGLCLTQYPDLVGELHIHDLGIPADCLPDAPLSALEAGDLAGRLPHRSLAAHKGSNGRVLIFAGSLGMAGAAAMAAQGCLRAGAGLVTIACESGLIPILQTLVPGAQCRSLQQIARQVPAHDVFLAGCGLREEEEDWRLLMQLYDPARPALLDAGALNMLASHPQRLGERTVLTPHIGEAARLLGQDAQSVLDDPLKAAGEMEARYGGVILLKSHCSVITDGSRRALNTLGSPALAKGGSGDALAGIIAGLMAQRITPYEAARTGSLWLGKAGKLAERRFGLHGALTQEVLSLLHEAIGAQV